MECLNEAAQVCGQLLMGLHMVNEIGQRKKRARTTRQTSQK